MITLIILTLLSTHQYFSTFIRESNCQKIIKNNSQNLSYNYIDFLRAFHLKSLALKCSSEKLNQYLFPFGEFQILQSLLLLRASRTSPLNLFPILEVVTDPKFACDWGSPSVVYLISEAGDFYMCFGWAWESVTYSEKMGMRLGEVKGTESWLSHALVPPLPPNI